jgi:uncharacterized protein DUF1990
MAGAGRARSRAALLLTWPAGLALVSWRYLWRTTPLHRAEERDTPAEQPPALPQSAVDDELQPEDSGVGPLFHRRYSVLVVGSRLSAAELMSEVKKNLNQAAPSEVAVFSKTRGDDDTVRAGDEYVVRMPGPWNGPVRVVEDTDTSFRLATLRGHLEAGQITFSAQPEGDSLRFTIESWSRSGDRLAHLLYDRLRFAKEIQLNMWTHFCLRTARIAGGRVRGGVTIRTRRFTTAAASPGSPGRAS